MFHPSSIRTEQCRTCNGVHVLVYCVKLVGWPCSKCQKPWVR